MIWLVDYTVYEKEIDLRLKKAKIQYFQIKNYKRYTKIGLTAPVKTRTFSNGLLRLATILYENDLPVQYIHASDFISILAHSEALPETIAFSAVCPTVPPCAELCDEIHRISPKTKVFLGGAHVNVAYDLTNRKYKTFDKLIRGYEFDAAEQIAEKPCSKVPDKYLNYNLLPHPVSEYAINTFTAMGCPFSCAYCVDGCAPHFESSIDGQLSELRERIPQRTLVHFFDCVLGYSQERLLCVCDALSNLQHGMLLSCDMRAEFLNEKTIQSLIKAGFVEIRLGIESADEIQLAQNNRFLKWDDLFEKIKLVRETSSLYITLYAATGLPGITVQGQEKTISTFDYLLTEQYVDEIKNCMYVPYPMDGLDYASRGIYIMTNQWEQFDRQSFPVYRTNQLSQDDLWELYLQTTEAISKSWLKSCGASSVKDLIFPSGYYSEYIVDRYDCSDEG